MKKLIANDLKNVILFVLAGVLSLAFMAFCITGLLKFMVWEEAREHQKEQLIEQAKVAKEKEQASKLALNKFGTRDFDSVESADGNVPHIYTVILKNDSGSVEMKPKVGAGGKVDSYVLTHKVDEEYVMIPEYGKNDEVKRVVAKPIKRIFVDLENDEIKEME